MEVDRHYLGDIQNFPVQDPAVGHHTQDIRLERGQAVEKIAVSDGFRLEHRHPQQVAGLLDPGRLELAPPAGRPVRLADPGQNLVPGFDHGA